MYMDAVHNDGIFKVGSLEAIRYGDQGGNLDADAVSRIARFVVGVDVETRITVLNERLMGVVTPMKEFWDPANGVADIIIVDPKSGTTISMGLGQWLTRTPKGVLRPVSNNQMLEQYLETPKPKTFEEELADLLVKHDVNRYPYTQARVLARYLNTSISNFNYAVAKVLKQNSDGS